MFFSYLHSSTCNKYVCLNLWGHYRGFLFITAFLAVFIFSGCTDKNNEKVSGKKSIATAILENSGKEKQNDEEIDALKEVENNSVDNAINKQGSDEKKLAVNFTDKNEEKIEDIKNDYEEKIKKIEAENEKALQKQADDKQKSEEKEKRERQDRVNKASNELNDIRNEITDEIDDLSAEMNILRQKIYDIENQNKNAESSGASQSVIDKQVAPVKSQLNTLQNEYSSLAQTSSKISSVLSALTNYAYLGTRLSSSDTSFLSSLGITFYNL
jgi:chromosome segregation ATPase